MSLRIGVSQTWADPLADPNFMDIYVSTNLCTLQRAPGCAVARSIPASA